MQSINGDGNPQSFAESCKQNGPQMDCNSWQFALAICRLTVVLRLTRPLVATSGADLYPLASAAGPVPSAAAPVPEVDARAPLEPTVEAAPCLPADKASGEPVEAPAPPSRLPEVRKPAPVELREDLKERSRASAAKSIRKPFFEETLKLLMPSEAFLSSFKVGLDPTSAKHFQQGIDAWKARI